MRTRFGLVLPFVLSVTAAGGELADYVGGADPATRWQKLSARDTGEGRVVEAELVSETWRGSAWRHALSINIPAKPRHAELAVLVIGDDGKHGYFDESRLASEAGVTVALLRNVPNQPLFRRSEDALVAFTFEQYLRSEELDWPLLLPMTKAAVRAMNAVSDLVKRETGAEIRRFVVTGASKRGWTTWLTAVADARVAAIVPVVFDNLNFGPQMKNQMAVWGRYSDMLGDYTERGLQELIDTERGRKLVSMVDPYAYRDAFARIPKLVISGSNDPYWELDSVNLYWPDLPAPKALLFVPNAGHDAGSHPLAAATVAAFVERVAEGRPLPELRWDDQSPRGVVSDETPARVRLWRADSASRDFRSARWRALDARRENGRFVADAAPPADGFSAFFAAADYESAGHSFALSTPVRIESARQAVERGQ